MTADEVRELAAVMREGLKGPEMQQQSPYHTLVNLAGSALASDPAMLRLDHRIAAGGSPRRSPNHPEALIVLTH